MTGEEWGEKVGGAEFGTWSQGRKRLCGKSGREVEVESCLQNSEVVLGRFVRPLEAECDGMGGDGRQVQYYDRKHGGETTEGEEREAGILRQKTRDRNDSDGLTLRGKRRTRSGDCRVVHRARLRRGSRGRHHGCRRVGEAGDLPLTP